MKKIMRKFNKLLSLLMVTAIMVTCFAPLVSAGGTTTNPLRIEATEHVTVGTATAAGNVWGDSTTDPSFTVDVVIPQKGYYDLTYLLGATTSTYYSKITLKLGDTELGTNHNTPVENVSGDYPIPSGYTMPLGKFTKENIWLEADTYTLTVTVAHPTAASNKTKYIYNIGYIEFTYDDSTAIITKESPKRFEFEDYATSGKVKTKDGLSNGALVEIDGWGGLKDDPSFTFPVYVKEDGYYNVNYAINQATKNVDTITLKMDGVEIGNNTSTGVKAAVGGSWHGNYLVLYNFVAPNKYLTAGWHDLSVSMTQGASAGGVYKFSLDYVEFECYEGIKVDTVKTNLEEDVLSGAIARGTDSFEITFNQKHKKECFEKDGKGEVILEDETGAEYPIEVSSDGEKITVKLKKTLNYSESYKLILNGIKDIYDIYSIENVEVPFSTKDTNHDTGEAKISITDNEFVGANIELTTKTLSSAGVAIEGREVNVYVKKPDGTLVEDPIYTDISGADGKNTIITALPADLASTVSGVYTIVVACEYAQESVTVPMPYITKDAKDDFLDKLDTAVKEEDPEAKVDGVYDAYKDDGLLLGINIDKDKEDNDLKDVKKIFAHIVNDLPTKDGEIITKYEKYLAVETINQATTTEPIEGVLTSEKLCGYLGFSFEKLNLILNEKSSLLEAILTLEEIQDSSQFISKVNELIEKYFAAEYKITAAELKTENLSCYVGQVATQNIKLAAKTDKITSVKIVVSADDVTVLEGLSAIAEKGFNVTNPDNDASKEVVFTSDKAVNIEEVGKIEFKNASTAKTYNITLNGEVTYDVGEEVEAKTFFTEKSFTITVSTNTNTSEGTTPSRPSLTPSKPSQTGGTVVQTPPAVKDEPEDEPKEEDPKEDYTFADLGNFDWAEEAIYELAKDGIISKSDDNNFNPSRNVTRAEFVKMVIVAFGLEEEGAKSDLSDVAEDAWYNEYVAAAEKHGIVSGDAEGNFRADESISRQDMAVIIKRAFEKKGLTIVNTSGDEFADDSDIAGYAKEAVYMMKAAKIINGMGENTFEPLSNATRAQAAKVIYETVKAVASK